MTEAEKELIMKDMANIIAERSMIVDFSVIFNQVNTLIARYPQVLAEKVWEGIGECISIDAIEPKDFCSEVIWSNAAGSGLQRVKVYIEVVKTPELLEGKS